MAQPRSRIVDRTRSGLYHCTSRCVRQAFLLQRRPDGSIDDHRRRWLVERLRLLISIFAIDCVAFAIMHNHFHALLRTLPEVVDTWSDAEIAYRWLLLHPNLALRARLGISRHAPPHPEEMRVLLSDRLYLELLRSRMSDLSWFMQELKGWFARKANDEDGVRGAFWESRYGSIRVLDEAGTLLCSSYIDLNPVKAGIVDDPMRASCTSVEEHIRRRHRELWHKLIDEADADGRTLPEDVLEACLDALDDAMFEPAMPARREAIGAGDEMVREMVTTEVTGERLVHEEQPSAVAHSPRPSRTAEARLRRAIARRLAEATRVRPATRQPPAVAVLPMSLGQYLRRLSAVAKQLVERARGAVDGRPANPLIAPDRHDPAPRDVGALLTTLLRPHAPPTAVDVLTTVLRTSTLRGTAAGATSSLALEAVRRQASRVIMAFRCKPPPGPFAATPAVSS